MTQPTTTPTRQERGRALAQRGAVKPLTVAHDVFHVKSSQVGHGPYSVRRLPIQGTWSCTCPDYRHIKPEPCKHIHAAQAFLQMPRVLLTVTPRYSAVACKAMARGVAFEDEAALTRHHETDNVTLETSWSIEYVSFLEEQVTSRGNQVAVLRAETGLRWYVPLEAWLAIQPLARNTSPEVELVAMGVAS